jgi:hypothetical protein
MHDLIDVRIEYGRPCRDGLGGHWKVFCSFAGEEWGFRFYGRDWLFIYKGNTRAWRSLSRKQQAQLRESVLAALERAALSQARRRNEARKFRDGMRWNIGLAIRDMQRRPPQSRERERARPIARSREPRHRSVRTGTRRTRAGPSSSDDEPEPDIGRLAAASARMLARIQHRAAERRMAVA